PSDLTPHHHGDKTRRRKLLALQRAYIGAVAQHAASVGQAINLFHTVADVDDRDAFLLEIVDDLEELLRLPRRQRRRRLVHDDDTGVGAKRACDLDKLPLAERKHADLRRRRKMYA